MQINLPRLTPVRLVREAIASYNWFNPEAPISPETASWLDLSQTFRPDGAVPALVFRNNEDGEYGWLGLGSLPWNALDFARFRCPGCEQVLTTKRPKDLGQGKRYYLSACRCLTVADQAPDQGSSQLEPNTLAR
jgi:hypothetical protein